MINSLAVAAKFFGVIMVELILLFVGISFLVGLIQEYVPESTIKKILTSKRGQGNILGAGLGALTPFCSCSTIPITVGLLNAGAPFGAAMSFLLASPLLNPVIIGMFLAFLGWRVTLIYALIAFTLAVLMGILWERFGLANFVRRVIVKSTPALNTGDSDLKSRLKRAFWGSLSLLRGVFPYLLLGVAIGAFIYGFVPADWITRLAGPQNPLAIPVAAVIGIPLYIRVETMIPLGMVLLQKGMSLGAVMALIIGGAGASIPELSMLASIFKPRLLAAFVVTILMVAVFAGYAYNIFLG
ncbi:permease [Peptococcaceae bacterium SCADC1_2_3]|jgi:hypothetical protein|nr:permease [Peptococcaceae bacterium SCADC1_2_3]KFI34530.1 permease [Peptococcaceae bacterium SCADC1_2_3]